MAPRVSVIIVNYNSKDILNCIKSIRENNFPQDKIEIIVVDNKSSDDSILRIRKKYKDVKIVELNENYGYGIGCNRGADVAQGKYLIFLTPDNIVSKEWLTNLVNVIENNKNIGTVTSRIMYYDNKDRINSLGCFLSAYGICGSVNTLEHLKPHSLDLFAPSGASFIIAKKTFDKIQGFDENLFLYAEDVDIGWRVLNLGLKNVLSPDSVTYHKTELSMLHKSPHFYFYNTRNSLLIIIKNATLPHIIPMVAFSSIFHLSRFITFLLTGRIVHAKATFSAVWWFVANLKRVIKIRSSEKNRNDLYVKSLLGFKESIPILLSKVHRHLT